MRKIYYCKSLPAVVGDQEALDKLFIAFGYYLLGKRSEVRGTPLDPMDEWRWRYAYKVPSSWFESGFMADAVEFGSVSWDIEIEEVNAAELIRKAELLYRLRMTEKFVTLLKIIAVIVLVIYGGARMWEVVAGAVS